MADETCGLDARPELWMEAGRALPSPGVQRDPAEPKDRSACRWVCACLGTPRSCDPTPTGGRWWRPRELVRRLTSAIPYPAWERPTASAARAKPRIGISPRHSRACSIPIGRTARLAASSIFGTLAALAGPSRYSIRQLAAPSAPGGRCEDRQEGPEKDDRPRAVAPRGQRAIEPAVLTARRRLLGRPLVRLIRAGGYRT